MGGFADVSGRLRLLRRYDEKRRNRPVAGQQDQQNEVRHLPTEAKQLKWQLNKILIDCR